ncbi:carbon-nitrogen hydrolase family protein [Planctomonas psychrotolerans]|uniref:carbon-nitrogen hydrolase family protein n=1 Tax=Planctomonas psychrotolerans TaxID=2528712 RepID=UPI00123A8049|nr:carbon-nitrogen hydrolase family protein [Planctomonas psychrotolerans]
MATHPPDFGVAVAQFAPGDDTAANLRSMTALAAVAAERGASIVVFPEYSSYFANELGENYVSAAESLDGPFVSALGDMARELLIHVVAGMVERTDEIGRVSNTLVAVDPSGALVVRYRKQHLYDAFGQRESDWILAGEVTQPETFDVNGMRVGLQTCYDIRFPEVSRRLVDEGADLILVPAEWVRGPLKEQHWRTLVTARALENTVYVAAADHAPPVGVGNSMIVDPMGVEMATIGEATDVAVAWVSAERIDAVRRINPALELRRFRVVPR